MKTNRRREALPEILELSVKPVEVTLLHERVDWLIRLRWIAVAGVCLTLAIAQWLGALDHLIPVLGVAAALALANALYWWQQQRTLDEVPQQRLVTRMLIQIVIDLVALTVLLHFAGGAENPFVLFYVFHIAIAGVLLPVKEALLVLATATVLWSGTVSLEMLEIIDHHPLFFSVDFNHDGGPQRWRSPAFMLGAIGALVATLASVLYFVTSLVSRWRAAEARRVHNRRVAMSRERLARIGTLAAGVAHAVGNPLQGLLNCVEMLRERVPADDESAVELLDLADESVQRIATVTKRLLLLHRDAPLVMMRQEPHAVVEDAVRFMRRQAYEAGVKLTTDTKVLPPLPLDADSIVEALVNVIENAIDASEQDGEVRVSLALVETSPRRARIEVADDGVGIEPALLEQVFDPFMTTKPVGRGTGLGLGIVQKAVKDHGGTVTIESELGRGTTARIDLPYA